MRCCMIGCGKLGKDCAEVISLQYPIVGYDIEKIESNGLIILQDLQTAVKDKDIIFIAVPTPHEKEFGGETPISTLPATDFDYTIVKNVLTELNSFCTKKQLVVLISTVLPGTIRKEFEPVIKNYRFIYNPYLIAMGTIKYDMKNPEMVIIGTKDGDTSADAELLVNFYKPLMENNPRFVIGTWDEAESIKIFYNTFISAKLSLVNMIQDVAQKNGNINVDVVTTALAESTNRIMGPGYMTAGMGDGGACHPRDNIALRYLAQRLDLGYDLFDTIMVAREKQAENLAKFLVEIASKKNLPILIHGKAYKPGVHYLEGSYSLLVGYYCKNEGYDPIYVDPYTDPSNKSYSAVVLLAHNNKITYGVSDKNDFYCKINTDSIIVDPWRSFFSNDYEVVHYGNTRTQ